MLRLHAIRAVAGRLRKTRRAEETSGGTALSGRRMTEFTLYHRQQMLFVMVAAAMGGDEALRDSVRGRLRAPAHAGDAQPIWRKSRRPDMVPVLNHNGRIVWETLAILEYLADLFPEKKLWPQDIGARALARSVATEMHSGFREVRYGWPMNLRRPKGHKPLDAEGETAARSASRRSGASAANSTARAGRSCSATSPRPMPCTRRSSPASTPMAANWRPIRAPMSMPCWRLPAMRHWYAEAAKEPWPEPGPDE